MPPDLGFNVGDQSLHLVDAYLSELLLDDEPRDWIKVVSQHRHAKSSAFDNSGAAAHEDVSYLEFIERSFLLMVSVVIVPHELGRQSWIFWCLCSCRN